MKRLIIIAAVFVFMAGSAAYAADWNFYGSARVNTSYSKIDKSPFTSTPGVLGLGALANTNPDTDNFVQNLQGNARIGAKVKVSDTLNGRFEYGAQSGNANLRLLYGDWNFGAGSLRVGQDYTPLLFPYSNQVYNLDFFNKGDHNMSTFGMLYGSRKAQIKLKFGGFQIAAVEPATLVSLAVPLIGGAAPSTEVSIPMIQAKYKYDFSQGHVSFAGAYHTFDVVSGGQEHDVDSWLVGMGGRLNVGAAYFKGNIWGGQNVGNQAGILVNGGIWSSTTYAGTGDFDGDGWGLAQWTGTEVIDRDAIAGLIVAGYEIRKGLYLEACYGYVKTELDDPAFDKDDAETYYLQSTIFLAPGVFLTPEIGIIDMKQENDPEVSYFTVKWQINF